MSTNINFYLDKWDKIFNNTIREKNYNSKCILSIIYLLIDNQQINTSNIDSELLESLASFIDYKNLEDDEYKKIRSTIFQKICKIKTKDINHDEIRNLLNLYFFKKLLIFDYSSFKKDFDFDDNNSYVDLIEDILDTNIKEVYSVVNIEKIMKINNYNDIVGIASSDIKKSLLNSIGVIDSNSIEILNNIISEVLVRINDKDYDFGERVGEYSFLDSFNVINQKIYFYYKNDDNSDKIEYQDYVNNTFIKLNVKYAEIGYIWEKILVDSLLARNKQDYKFAFLNLFVSLESFIEYIRNKSIEILTNLYYLSNDTNKINNDKFFDELNNEREELIEGKFKNLLKVDSYFKFLKQNSQNDRFVTPHLFNSGTMNSLIIDKLNEYKVIRNQLVHGNSSNKDINFKFEYYRLLFIFTYLFKYLG